MGCDNCGTPVSDSLGYCPECGEYIREQHHQSRFSIIPGINTSNEITSALSFFLFMLPVFLLTLVFLSGVSMTVPNDGGGQITENEPPDANNGGDVDASNDEQPEFEIVEMSLRQDTFVKGEETNVAVIVRNRGDQEGESSIQFEIGDETEVENIVLNSGEESTIEFSVNSSRLESGIHQYIIRIGEAETEGDFQLLSREEYIEKVTKDAIEGNSYAENISNIEITGNNQDGFTIEAEYEFDCAFCDGGDEWLERIDRTTISMFEDIFESDINVELVRFKTITETVDIYGNTSYTHVHTVAINQETASQINWDNFYPSTTDYIVVADEYWFEASVFRNS